MLGITSLLLFVTSVMFVKTSAFAGTPLDRRFYGAIQLEDGVMPELKRHTRSATGNVPCVSVSFLTNLQSRFRSWFDVNNDGIASFQEMKNFFRKFKPNVKDDQVAAFITRRDLNGNGVIEFIPEYVQDLSSPDYTVEAATEWFQLHDADDNGAVSESELVKMAQAIGMPPEVALDNVRGYYMSYDADKDGALSFDEYKQLYS